MARHGFQDMPLAIIGMACRLPGADGLEQYWQLLRDGGSAVEELPPQRFDAELYFHPERGVAGKSYTRLGGVVPEKPFDRNACPIPEELIASSDLVPLSMLEVAAAACRHAGLDPLGLPLRNTGVFVGHARGGPLAGDVAYATHIEEVAGYLQHVDAFTRLPPTLRDPIVPEIVQHVRRHGPRRAAGRNPDVAPGAVAGLISEAFRLTGPCMAVDAACASSLFGVALAAQALRLGQIDMAIVGGASYSNWYSLVIFSHAQALSATGSFPFDARADGFISSDGYAAVLLKTLARAVADGDRVYGVIRGLGMSCDGRGKSLWAPRKEGQIEAIRRAYGGGLDPARIQYIEAHGTSTQLGDATELEALAAALGDRFPPGTRIPIGSVKANIGHTRETAGLASLIKTVLAMQHGVVPPAANFATPNPQIPWDRIPFFVPTAPAAWPAPRDGQPRRAAIDAFGIGGLNLHLVVDDYPPGARGAVPAPAELAAPPTVQARPREVADDVAVIGLGAILPGARTIAAYWDLLVSGGDPKIGVPPDRWNADIFLDRGSPGPWRVPTGLGGFVTDFAYDWRRHRIPPRQLETADPLQFMLLDAADQSLRDAGYDRKAFDRRTTGVVVGTVFGGDFAGQLNRALRLPEFQRTLAHLLRHRGVPEGSIGEVCRGYAEVFARHHQVIHDETGSYTSSTLASRIAKTFDLMGGAFAVDAGEASSLAALAAAVDLLRSGACDLVLCAGAQRAMDVSQYRWYAARGVLSADRPRAGFDAAADGFVPAEGVGMVLLKRLRDARRDGDAVRAIVRGVGAGMDASSPGAAMRLAIQRALSSSGVEARGVTVVETAGLGVPHVDAEEADALAALYGREARGHPLLLGSLAGQIGHAQGASGMASLLKLILALQHRRMPSSVGLVQPGDPVARRPSVLRPVTEPVALPVLPDDGSGFAGASALALRGLAYHAVLERPPEVPAAPAAAPAGWRIAGRAAGTAAELARWAARGRDEAAALFAAAARPAFTARDGLRLAIVADGPEALARKLRLAGEQLTSPQARPALEEQGIFCREPGPEPPRVAFLFSGQGSQYPGMLRELVRDVPAAAAMLQEIDGTMSRLGHPSFAQIAWGTEGGLGTDVWRTQVSVLLADTIVHAALAAMGIRPDAIGAHSYGEYPALVAAGAWTLEQAIRVTRARCEAIEASPQADGVMLSTTAPPEAVQRLAAGIPGTLCVANHNAPDQTVVGGRREAVLQLESRLASEGFEAQVLPVPRPFHTPLMAPVKDPLRRVLEGERVRPVRIPLLSSVTNRYVADPSDIRANLVEQLTAPVRYVDLIRRLADDGVTVFIEVGPRQVLTHLHRRILAGRDAAIIASDHPKRPGGEQLCRVRALLECAGAFTGHEAAEAAAGGEAGATAGGASTVRHEIVHFDATARRRQRAQRAPEPSSEPAPRTAAAAPADELESFLVNFVCEQTGYPPEIVELDADLEADLGLDSIKKAHLFGELRERFHLRPVGTLTLEEFPTLRHVLSFLRQAMAQPAPAPAEDPRAPAAPPAILPGRAELPPRPPAGELSIVRCLGTPYEMGLQHARGQADQIVEILRKYAELLRGHLGNMEELPQAFAQADAFFTPAGLEELRGMAAGLDMPLEYLFAYNLGLYPEHIAGCSQFAITAGRNGAAGMLHGVNEDAPISLRLPDALTRIVQVRHPAAGIPHILFTASGQLGGLNGINARGLAASSTLLADRPRRASGASGMLHPVLVMAVLARAEDIESAVEIVRGAERLGAFSLCLSHHPTDRLCYLEYDGASLQVQQGKDQVLTTNHCLLHVSQEVPQHSACRLTRLRHLLAPNGQAGYTLAQAQAALRDRYDVGRQRETAHPTMNTIRRIDNQASIVMRPAAGEVWVTPGPLAGERADAYCRLDLQELFAAPGPPAHPAREDLGAVACESGGATGPRAEELPPDEGGRVMGRYVLRTAEVPLDGRADRVPRFHGPALLLGQNATALALRGRLEEAGVVVVDLPVSDDPEETLAALDRAWQAHPSPHLFLMTARDEYAVPPDDEAAWARRRSRGLLLPYLVCQRWTRSVSAADLLQKATLVAATALGGDFGFSGRVAAAEGGGLAGLLKSVRREFPGLTAKAIDAPAEESPKVVAAAIWNELAAGAPEAEVGCVRGQRYLVRAVPRPASAAPGREIARGGTWVVTGGARGITAFVARELGRRFGLRLHLVGKSPAPGADAPWRGLSDAALKALRPSLAQEARRAGRDPAAAWREVEKAIEIDGALRAFAEAGVRATYHACDVSDRRALAGVLEEIRRCDGPIRGVLHGAGVEEAARFDRKNRERVSATIGAKVDGAAALMALTRGDPLAYFVAFGSVSGRFGGIGQTDYGLASDMLCKLIQSFRHERPACASVAIHWPAWDEVGMAMRPESRLALAVGRQRFMPPREGVEHLLEELRAGAPEGEVLILDEPGILDLDGTMPTPAQRAAHRRGRARAAGAPLIEGLAALDDGRGLTAEARFHPASDPFLRDHRFQGVPLLPAVIGLEAMGEAAAILAGPRAVVGLRDVRILNGLRFHSDRPQEVRIQAAVTGGGIACQLRADFSDQQGRLIDPHRVYLAGTVDIADRPPALPPAPATAGPRDWTAMRYRDEGEAREAGLVFHGPSLRCLQQVSLDAEGIWGRVLAPPPTDVGEWRGPGWILPAAALDACLVACGVFASQRLKVRQLPQAFERLRIGRPPHAGETCTVHVRLRGRQERSTCFDFTLVGDDGTVILDAEGHHCVILAGS
ncbi:MAG TPA: C45 family autoproteolytic acyltransferase/hydrolase [Candidatus Sulfotelmatobacter sp.]|nr:C45 family autoproteolytic acyltransferase/hydrolase [Candidatus Sulfotelmatobacter sp.]